MQVYQNKIIRVCYDPQLKAVRMVLNGFASQQQYTEAWDNALRIAAGNRCNRWLIDQKNFKGTPPEALKWAVEEWYPHSVKELNRLGIREARQVAIVVSVHIFGEVSTRNAINRVEDSGKDDLFHYFKTESEATAYLEKGM